jgi:peptide/nickel transport system permease protein
MATDDRATFTEVDWESADTSSSFLSRIAFVELAVFVVLVGTYIYDYTVIKNVHPTIDLTIPGVGWNISWDITGSEWIFIATLILMFFQLVVPLIQNSRMRAYYWTEFKKNRVAVVSLVFLVLILLGGIVGPVFMEPPTVHFTDRTVPPAGITADVNGVQRTGTWEHPFGTTAKGEDILKLVVYGMRVSMMVGLGAVALAVAIGSIVGTVAAYATSINRGLIDEVLMRYVDLQSVFPVFLLLLLIIYLLSPKLWYIIALYGLFSWEGIARASRAEALQRAEEEYVQAARAAGANTGWIVRRHLIPNVSNTIITLATLLIPAFILGEATLAFLGFSDPSVASWGRVVAEGRDNLAGGAWWISTIPGLFLFLTTLAFNFVGDAARDALDPRHEVNGE